MKFGGVTLNVKDLEAAKKFYGALPGANLVRDEPEIASYKFGEARVSLRKESEPGFHLEMEAGDIKEAEGSNIVERKEDKVFLEDPDGHRIEVEKDKESSHGGIKFNPERDEENAGIG